MVGSYHVIPLQESGSHFHEIAETGAEQFHIYQGADMPILFHKNTFEPGGVKTEEVIRLVKSGHLRFEFFGGQVDVQKDALA